MHVHAKTLPTSEKLPVMHVHDSDVGPAASFAAALVAFHPSWKMPQRMLNRKEQCDTMKWRAAAPGLPRSTVCWARRSESTSTCVSGPSA